MTDSSVHPAQIPSSVARSSKARRKLTSSAPLLLANLVETIVPFLRNVALARLLAPDQFGLAISLAAILGLIEVLTDFGLPIFAVRKPAALSDATAMASLHSLALVRSAWLAALLVLVSPIMAHVFDGGSSMWIYALLGPVALMRGFENLGVKEMMRQYVFWREAIVIVAAQVIGLAITVAAAAAGMGMSSMICGLVASAIVTLILSHILSPNPFRLGWDRAVIKEAAAFGRPLLLNGAAVAITTNDRLLVGSALGPAALALYGVAYGTATLPRSVLARFLTSAFLPLFVEQRDRKRSQTPLLDAWSLCLSGTAFLYGLGLSLLGDRLLGLVFGATYQPSRLFMCLAGMSVGVKFLMLLPSPAAYADGSTRQITLSSILSAASIVPAALCLFIWRDLNLFLATGILCEFCGLLLLARQLGRELAFTAHITWIAIFVPFLLIGGLAVLADFVPTLDFAHWTAACSIALVAALLAYGLTLRSTSLGSAIAARI